MLPVQTCVNDINYEADWIVNSYKKNGIWHKVAVTMPKMQSQKSL